MLSSICVWTRVCSLTSQVSKIPPYLGNGNSKKFKRRQKISKKLLLRSYPVRTQWTRQLNIHVKWAYTRVLYVERKMQRPTKRATKLQPFQARWLYIYTSNSDLKVRLNFWEKFPLQLYFRLKLDRINSVFIVCEAVRYASFSPTPSFEYRRPAAYINIEASIAAADAYIRIASAALSATPDMCLKSLPLPPNSLARPRRGSLSTRRSRHPRTNANAYIKPRIKSSRICKRHNSRTAASDAANGRHIASA